MKSLAEAWYTQASWLKCLRPLSLIFSLVTRMRRRWYRKKGRAYTSRLPVIVVGNLTAGGTGKTPLVIYLAQALQREGYKPGIVSRGYGSKAPAYPFLVTRDSAFLEAGEEPLMIARNTGCPVIIDPDRVAAIRQLESHHDCDIIISDDGLQHYSMNRAIEIVVIDGQRGFGNEQLIPEGPLREKPERLKEVDMVVCNGTPREQIAGHYLEMSLIPRRLVHLLDQSSIAIDNPVLGEFSAKKVHAVAGIGNPARFFTSLCDCGFDIISHIFPDHYIYNSHDIQFPDDLDVVMTEKDAIKCAAIATEKHWYLEVESELPETFIKTLLQKLADASGNTAAHDRQE